MATSTRGKNVSKAILAALQESNPAIKAKGWRKATWDAFAVTAEAEGLEFKEAVYGLHLEPDAYTIDEGLTFFEIEVYNPMSQDKLTQYAIFQQDLDYYGIPFSVLAVNKHGHVNEVDLYPYYGTWLCANAAKLQNPEGVALPASQSS